MERLRALADVMVTSTNAPIMIGGAPVLPGDVIPGRDQGVGFISVASR